MQYKKEIIFVVVALLIIIIIGKYIVQNQAVIENNKNEQITTEKDNGEKKPDIHDTFTGVYVTGTGFEDNRVLKVDSTGTVALEVFKEGNKTIQFGSWVINTQKELVVSILGEEGKGQYDSPIVFVFAYNTDKLLVANTYDSSLYKVEDVTFKKLGEREISDMMDAEEKFFKDQALTNEK